MIPRLIAIPPLFLHPVGSVSRPAVVRARVCATWGDKKPWNVWLPGKTLPVPFATSEAAIAYADWRARHGY